MITLNVLDLFAGIGGFSLGLERAKHDGPIKGFQTAAFCEIEEFPRKVLAKHWPEVPCYGDVRTLTAEQLVRDGIGPIDVITGGFPCQDISTAGKQAGIAEGTRSGLWSEIVRLVSELRPQFVIVENVANLLRGPSERPGAWFSRVLGDLVEIGYDAEWHCIPASELGAHHHRDRVWVVAYARHGAGSRPEGGKHLIEGIYSLQQEDRRKGTNATVECGEDVADPAGIRQSGQGKPFQPCRQAPIIDRETVIAIASRLRSVWSTEPDVGRVAHGIPDRAHRLKGLGNNAILETINGAQK